MRAIMTLGLVVLAALSAGCQVVGYAGNPNFDNPFVNDTIGPHQTNFPWVLKFPDDTMYFFPIYNDERRSDLTVLAMRCSQDDGRLVVNARVQNLGSSPIVPDWFTSGELGAIRVVAIATSTDGTRERRDFASQQALTVAAALDVSFPMQTFASDVVRVDVVADPDRVVPDPLRDNNVLTWQRGMGPGAAECNVLR
jgi:hypothetical protein